MKASKLDNRRRFSTVSLELFACFMMLRWCFKRQYNLNFKLVAYNVNDLASSGSRVMILFPWKIRVIKKPVGPPQSFGRVRVSLSFLLRWIMNAREFFDTVNNVELLSLCWIISDSRTEIKSFIWSRGTFLLLLPLFILWSCSIFKDVTVTFYPRIKWLSPVTRESNEIISMLYITSYLFRDIHSQYLIY
jgi:hypothetical protein